MAIGSDRVQPAKYESTAEGGDDADAGLHRDPTPIVPQEDAIESAGHYLQDAANRDELVYIERNGDDLRFRDENNTTPVTLTTLTAGGGMSESAHKTLDQWVHHDLAEDCHYDVEWSVGRVSAERWYTDGTKTQKIREVDYTYTGNNITTEVRKSYDASETLVETVTITYTYSSGRVDYANYVVS